MSTNEFIEKLKQALEGEVPQSVIRSNVQFYQDYIRDEISKGRTEEEVLEELGDPRLLARTIFDSQEAARGRYGESYTYNEEGGGEYDSSPTHPEVSEGTAPEIWTRIKGTVILIGIAVVILGILSVLFSAAARVLTTPVFWIMVLVIILVRAKF